MQQQKAASAEAEVPTVLPEQPVEVGQDVAIDRSIAEIDESIAYATQLLAAAIAHRHEHRQGPEKANPRQLSTRDFQRVSTRQGDAQVGQCEMRQPIHHVSSQHSGEWSSPSTVLEGYAMIRASHLAKGLDSDVGCQPCLNTHSDTWYVPLSTIGAGISRRCGATAWAAAPLFAHTVERVLGVGPECHVTVAR